MGSKYLDRAPFGLRIVILSKGSCVIVDFVVIFKQIVLERSMEGGCLRKLLSSCAGTCVVWKREGGNEQDEIVRRGHKC